MIRFVALFCLLTCGYCFTNLKFSNSLRFWSHLAATTNENAIIKKKIIAPKFEGKCDRTGVTLTRYLIEAVAANPQIKELESVRIRYEFEISILLVKKNAYINVRT